MILLPLAPSPDSMATCGFSSLRRMSSRRLLVYVSILVFIIYGVKDTTLRIVSVKRRCEWALTAYLIR